jgi:hypothetical protein
MQQGIEFDHLTEGAVLRRNLTMNLNRFAVPVLAFALGTGLVMAQQYGPPQDARPSGYDRGPGGWDAPPEEFREIRRQGFHDGIDGAKKDFDNHRRPDVRNRDEFRHPRVARSERDDYREGFRRGYEVAMNHLQGEERR